jgi:hypothetical protein
MKIFEILESIYESSTDYSKKYKDQYINAINNFDVFIDHHGTAGANILFDKLINETKNIVVDFVLKADKSYSAMIEARTRLEEKIKKSNGISY